MKACPDRYETILLAAYGELDPEQRQDWERHLPACTGCSDEYQAVLRLLGRIKESMPVPELSEKRASSILWSVKRELRKGTGKTVMVEGMACAAGPPCACTGNGLPRPDRLWLVWDEPDTESDTEQDSMGPGVETQAVVKDLEIIKNIEFLEDLDTLRELVTVLDRNESI